MQDLLGAPPQGTTQQVVDAFAPLADPDLLDKDPARSRSISAPIQMDKLVV